MFSFPTLIENLGLSVDGLTDRQKVEVLEFGLLAQYNNIAEELPLKHIIAGGMYYREMFIPAGVCLTGKIHKEEHLCMLLSGEISVLTDDGMKHLTGPQTFISSPGAKRAGYAHTDVIFATVHKTDLTKLADIEAQLFEDSDLSWIKFLVSGDTENDSSSSSGGS